MKLPVIVFTALTFFVCLVWASCSKDNGPDYLGEADCSSIDVLSNTYTFRIVNILNGSCAVTDCHDAATQQNGINFSTYATAKAAFQNNDVLCAINHGAGCEPMPKGGTKLQQTVINELTCWAKNGYVE